MSRPKPIEFRPATAWWREIRPRDLYHVVARADRASQALHLVARTDRGRNAADVAAASQALAELLELAARHGLVCVPGQTSLPFIESPDRSAAR